MRTAVTTMLLPLMSTNYISKDVMAQKVNYACTGVCLAYGTIKTQYIIDLGP
jgi:hypothetical protein